MSDHTPISAPGMAGDASASETDRLIASDKVEGTAVYNHQGERLGSIHSVMLDKYSGQISYAVMSFGGFLGIGESYHPLPWKTLTYDPAQGGYVVNVSREQLESAPRYARDETPWTTPDFGRRVSDYYGAPSI